MIAQLGGFFVILRLHGASELLAQAGEIRLSLGRNTAAAATGGDFADVMGGAFVGALKQRGQVPLEQFIVVVASQKAALAKLGPGVAAMFARDAGFLGQPGVGHHKIGQQFVDRRVPLDRNPLVLRGTLLAQMFFDLLTAFDLGEMNGRRFAAVVAFHWLIIGRYYWRIVFLRVPGVKRLFETRVGRFIGYNRLFMKIAELFYSIQGEGKLAGVPSVFVRSAGCNLRCVWCDTPYASWEPQGQEMTVERIVEEVKAFGARHVVLTGGEPMIMPEIAALCDALCDGGYHITLETAGTVYRPVRINLASVSPKLSNSTPWERQEGRFAKAHERQRLNLEVIQRFIDNSPDFQLKFVVTSDNDLPEIEAILDGLSGWTPSDVLLMPEGIDQATLNSRAGWIAEVCKRTGYRFCPRLHVALYGNKRGT